MRKYKSLKNSKIFFDILPIMIGCLIFHIFNFFFPFCPTMQNPPKDISLNFFYQILITLKIQKIIENFKVRMIDKKERVVGNYFSRYVESFYYFSL